MTGTANDKQLVASFGDFNVGSNKARRVMILVDESLESQNCLTKALKDGFVSETDSLILIHSRQPDCYNPSMFMYEEYDNEAPFILATRHEFAELNQALETGSIELLKRLCRQVERSGKYRNCKAYSVSSYTARDELIKQIDHFKPDLVIMGGRSNSQEGLGASIERIFVGSVSNFLCGKNIAPLLIIRPLK